MGKGNTVLAHPQARETSWCEQPSLLTVGLLSYIWADRNPPGRLKVWQKPPWAAKAAFPFLTGYFWKEDWMRSALVNFMHLLNTWQKGIWHWQEMPTYPLADQNVWSSETSLDNKKHEPFGRVKMLSHLEARKQRWEEERLRSHKLLQEHALNDLQTFLQTLVLTENFTSQ